MALSSGDTLSTQHDKSFFVEGLFLNVRDSCNTILKHQNANITVLLNEII